MCTYLPPDKFYPATPAILVFREPLRSKTNRHTEFSTNYVSDLTWKGTSVESWRDNDSDVTYATNVVCYPNAILTSFIWTISEQIDNVFA